MSQISAIDVFIVPGGILSTSPSIIVTLPADIFLLSCDAMHARVTLKYYSFSITSTLLLNLVIGARVDDLLHQF